MFRNGECRTKKVENSRKRVDVTQTRYEAEYQTIKRLGKQGFKIMLLCESLKVSRAGYYKWLNRKPTKSEKRLRHLIQLIQQVYHKHKGIYGYRRITIYLNYFLNAKVNHKCVYRLMRLLEIKAVIRRKRYNYKPHSPQHIAENVLDRAFNVDYEPMQVLLTDVTEFKYGNNSKAYLSAILDYGANKIVAYKMSNRNNNALVNDTIIQINDLILPRKTLLHSDRGFQYTSHFFKKFIEDQQIIQSMSRVGKCIDNGPMENFWGIIKVEMYRLKNYETFKELENDVKQYIKFYNTRRVTLKMGLSIPA